MARVPVYNSPQVAANTLAPARIAVAAMPTVAGQDARQIGAAMQQFGEQAGRVALDMAAQANQLRVDDALNKAKEAALKLTYDQQEGFTSLKGANALDRPDGKPLADEYGEKLQKQFSGIADTLGNDAQRTAFSLHANDILTSFRGQAIRHETGEFQTYALSTSEGIQSTALRDIGLNWNNPEAVTSAVERIRAETYRQAQLLGKSAEWQEAQARKLTSNAHKVALLAALEQNDPGYADGYLRKFSGQMDADDILTVRGHITREMNTRVGFGAAFDAVGNTHAEVSEGERAFNIAVNTESGGRQFDANGAPLTSAKGAVGIAQVMPDTGPEAAKLAGLSWDESRYRNDPDYNRALGMAYFQKQLRDNGGDLAKAYAAYNAGPGALKDAVQKAKEGGNWLAELPKETQDYVAKNMAAFQAGQGKPERPTFADIDARLRADPRLADNPARYKVAREEAARLFKEQSDAIKQRDEAAVANAMRGLVENGGRFSSLPVAVRAAVPPDKLDDLIGFAGKISKGDDRTSLWLYNKLTNSPEELAKLTDDQFYALRKELSEADFKHFADERAKRTGAAPGGNGPGDLNSTAIKQGIDGRLRVLGIDPSPKDDGGADAARVGAIRQFVDQYFLTAQREAGKKFGDAEVSAHLDGLFAKNVTLAGYFSKYPKQIMTMKAGDIPSDEKASIKAALVRQGVGEPTDGQILNLYLLRQTARKEPEGPIR